MNEPTYVVFERGGPEKEHIYVPTWVVAKDEDDAVELFLKGYVGSQKWYSKTLIVAPLKACSEYTVEPTFDVDGEPWKP